MKLAFIASSTPQAQEAFESLTKLYGNAPIGESECVVVLGGDGLVLKTFYNVVNSGVPVLALRRTESVGFMCNDYNPDNLPERIQKAQRVILHPLRAESLLTDGAKVSSLATNEITILRDSPQSAKLRILIDGTERINSYSGDGILVATPAGSTAYNHSAGGPIMPLDANTLVMTAICGFRPRRWSYAVLPQEAVTEIEVQEPDKRPVRLEAGPQSTHNIVKAKIWLDRATNFTLLFDPDQHLGEKIVREQFMR